MVDGRDVPAFLEGQEVTMRGDLEQISLSDIFQTLAMSKMEGLLRVCNPLEQRTLYFCDGFVKDLYFGRPENQRLGQRLLRAGLIGEGQLEAALRTQEADQRPLGAILVEAGALTQDDIDDVARYQAAEDLYALFTWKHGWFEFYKGAPGHPQIEGRIAVVPRFDVNSVLLEVARRSDEWELILRRIHSVDEIPLPLEPAEPPPLEGDQALVMQAVDGNRSVRELADITLLGLFDCGRALRSLAEQGLVELAHSDELLAIAEMQRLRGDVKRAVVTLSTLVDRGEGLDLPTTRELAAAMERCGEPRRAGQCLWRAAQECQDPVVALELAREACRLDKRSSYVLEHLLELLAKAGVEGEEVLVVTSDLADALVDEGREEDALAAISRLEALSADLASVLSRKARLLQRLERPEAAVAELERLGQLLKKDKRRDELVTVYEQILMLDYRRRDIAWALRGLKTSKRVQRLIVAVAGMVLLGLGVAGWLWVRHVRAMDRLAALISSMNDRVDAGQIDGLTETFEGAIAEFGDRPELDDFGARLRRAVEQRHEARRRDNAQQQRKQMTAAADHLERGELPAALEIYGRLLAAPGSRKEVEEVAKGRVASLAPHLDRLASTLPLHIPEPASDIHTDKHRTTVLAGLASAFPESDLVQVRGVLQARGSEILAELLGADERDRLVANAVKVEQLFRQARELERQYTEAQKRADAKQRLEPVFLAARQHEQAHAFAAAADEYRQLLAEYPVDNELKADFRAKVQRLEKILSVLHAIDEATAKGDYKVALEGLRSLRGAHPEIPFEQLARLPLRVETNPPGALVKINGEERGRSPLLTSYIPSGTTRVEVALPKYHGQSTTFAGDAVGTVRALLARKADWATMVRGSVQRPPACSSDGRAFVVDREGSITALDTATGDALWFRATGDLSGLLPTPALFGATVIIASFDGRLRCLDRATGDPVWQVDDLRCEGAPVVAGDVLLLATVEGEAVGIDAASGAERYRLTLPGPARTDLVPSEERAFLTTQNGHVVALDVVKGVVLWSTRVGQRIAAAPAASAAAVLACTDDGHLVALAPGNGAELWSRDGLGEVLLAPCIAGGLAVVANGVKLSSFRLADGESGPAFEGKSDFSAAPVFAAGKLIVGDRDGVVLVLDPASFEFRYQIRGEAPISAGLVLDAAGRALVAFEDRIVQCFLDLP